MDRLEQAIVLECLRELRSKLKLGTAKELAQRLVQIDQGIDVNNATDCINKKPIKMASQGDIASAILMVLGERYPEVVAYYDIRNQVMSAHLSQIFEKYKVISQVLPQKEIKPEIETQAGETGRGYSTVIFRNWRDTFRRGNAVLHTGIYQMYRRYKPTQASGRSVTINPYDQEDPLSHAVICEMIYVDSDAMECVMVTSELNVYHGTMFINHEDILYGILQRRARGNGINQRFIAMRLEGRRLPMYSGLCIKTGDTTRRPIACECLYVNVPQPNHSDVYTAFNDLLNEKWTGGVVPTVREDSIIADYIASNPPMTPYERTDPAWSRVKSVGDFNQLKELVTSSGDNVPYFREPLRTLSLETLAGMARNSVLPVFRHSKHT